MTTLASEAVVVIGGVDTHADVHVVAACDRLGGMKLACAEASATEAELWQAAVHADQVHGRAEPTVAFFEFAQTLDRAPSQPNNRHSVRMDDRSGEFEVLVRLVLRRDPRSLGPVRQMGTDDG